LKIENDGDFARRSISLRHVRSKRPRLHETIWETLQQRKENRLHTYGMLWVLLRISSTKLISLRDKNPCTSAPIRLRHFAATKLNTPAMFFSNQQITNKKCYFCKKIRNENLL